MDDPARDRAVAEQAEQRRLRERMDHALGYPRRCPDCDVPLEVTNAVDGHMITTSTTCSGCGSSFTERRYAP